MKNLLLLSLVLFLFSCTIEKRLYRPGYHVESHLNFKTSPRKIKKENANFISARDTKDLLLEAKLLEPSIQTQSNLLIDNDSKRCDTIIFHNGTRLLAKVESVSREEIKYIKCENLDGPLYIERTSYISFIHYANGVKEKYRETQNPVISENIETVKTPAAMVEPPLPPPIPSSARSGEKEIESFGILGFILFITSGLLANSNLNVAVVFGMLSLVFSIVSLARFADGTDRWKGKFFPIFVLVLFFIGLIIVL
jgi:hypothetical protein